MFSKKPETDMSNFDQQKPITKTTSKAIGGQPAPAVGLAPMGGPAPAPAPSQQAFAPKPPAFRGPDRMAPSIIGEDLTVTGNVLSRGEVQVDGTIQGDVHCSSLIVGEKARSRAGSSPRTSSFAGGSWVRFAETASRSQQIAHVEGDVFHKSLAIEQGAYFEGKSRRSEDPIASAPRLEGMTAQTPQAAE